MKYPIPKTEAIPSIAELNRDVESFVVQGSAMRSRFFGDKHRPLQFLHFSDVHAVPEMWERIVQYVNEYSDFLEFALHTGDYCGASQEQYYDLYGISSPCERPIYNCVGNHDTDVTTKQIGQSDKETVHRLLFSSTEGWEVSFMPCEHSMAYCKDFSASGVRLIVLDCYYGGEAQALWLRGLLEEAREQGLAVITAMHEVSSPITQKADVTFQTLNDYESKGGNCAKHSQIENELVAFLQKGGVHVCNLVGHEHSDMFGYTQNGILNIAVECATKWDGWCDGKRIRGTRTYDCMNVVSVDVTQNLLKLVRVGDNADHFLRIKRTLCYDYVQKRVIFNG